MDINEWTAEKCGIRTLTVDATDEVIWNPSGNNFQIWTMNDARCREIVREHFKIHTEFLGRDVIHALCFRLSDHNCFSAKTIAEAEIACIEAIMKAEIDNG